MEITCNMPKQSESEREDLLLVLVLLFRPATARLESLDLRGNPLLALRMGEPLAAVLVALRFPVLVLLSRLERRVLSNGCVSIGENLLNVLGADTVRKVRRELLLEAVGRR